MEETNLERNIDKRERESELQTNLDVKMDPPKATGTSFFRESFLNKSIKFYLILKQSKIFFIFTVLNIINVTKFNNYLKF